MEKPVWVPVILIRVRPLDTSITRVRALTRQEPKSSLNFRNVDLHEDVEKLGIISKKERKT
jgi:hypothetical protein